MSASDSKSASSPIHQDPSYNNNNNNNRDSHRKWKAALNLLWAASHLGHNTTDTPLGPVHSANNHEVLGPSQSGGTLPLQQLVRGTLGGSGGGPSSLAEFLRTVPHFYLLNSTQLNHLADFGLRRDFLPGEVVLEYDADVTQVRVILAGVVDVVDRTHGTVGTMEASSVFGLDSIIIGERAPFRFVCSRACSLLLLPSNDVLKVLKSSPFMRQSIGRKMSGQMSCFRVLKEFSRLLFSHDAMKYEYIPLQNILESYNHMTDSVVHSLKTSKKIDTTAWYYATQRLPENITRVFSLDLVRSLPPFLATRMRSLTRKAERARQAETVGEHQQQQQQQQQQQHSARGVVHAEGPNQTVHQQHGYGSSGGGGAFHGISNNAFNASGSVHPLRSPSFSESALNFNSSYSSPASPPLGFQYNLSDYRSRDIRYVHTSQRRRCVWQLGIDGKNIVLMRDDFTDYLDFVLSLCIHIVESSKLRGRLQSLVSPSAIDVIEEALYRGQILQNQQIREYQQQQQQQSNNESGASSARKQHSRTHSGNECTNFNRSQSGVPTTVLNATGYNGIRDVAGHLNQAPNSSAPETPISPPGGVGVPPRLNSSSGTVTPQSPGALVGNVGGGSSSTAGSPLLSSVAPGFSQDQIIEILQNSLRLTEEESRGIVAIWGTNTLKRLHDVLMHREEYLLRADSSVARRFQSDPFHDWALGVRGAVVRRLSLDPHSPLPDDLSIDLVFGLTRSMLNCLSPCARLYKEEILEYGHKEHPEVMSQAWNSEEDKLYALIPDFLNENPEMRDAFNDHLDDSGIEVLEDTALTGLQADIICADFLDQSGLDEWLQAKLKQSPLQHQQSLHSTASVNLMTSSNNQTPQSGTNGTSAAGVPRFPSGSVQNTPSLYHTTQESQQQHAASTDFDSNTNNTNSSTSAFSKTGARFLINIDYTFGAQAEGILKTLVTVFGRRIRSVNVLGKIAGFKGTRAGDVIIADNVVSSKMSLTSEDHMDEIRTINNQGLRMERVQEFLGNSKRKVRRGSVLTVATSMLCDASIISYYKNIWNCTGFEIEGSYFARMVKECKSNGLLQHDMPLRHMYLVRELPEEHDGSSTFAKPRYAGEVLSAQYVIARSILDIVLRRENNSSENNNNTNQQQQQGSSSTGGGGARHAHFATSGRMNRTETAPI